MSDDLFSVSQLKSQARKLRAALDKCGTSVSHSNALELVAQQHGFRDWNTLHAQIPEERSIASLRLGEKVTGTYLGKEFSAVVMGLKSTSEHGRVRITVKFDAAIDVVQSDSFSNFRRQVSCVLNRDARTTETTSAGVPHMQLELA